MARCQHPKCERIVRDPNKFGLCHIHLEMGGFFLWFSDHLQRMSRIGATTAQVRNSGLIVPPTAR